MGSILFEQRFARPDGAMEMAGRRALPVEHLGECGKRLITSPPLARPRTRSYQRQSGAVRGRSPVSRFAAPWCTLSRVSAGLQTLADADVLEQPVPVRFVNHSSLRPEG